MKQLQKKRYKNSQTPSLFSYRIGNTCIHKVPALLKFIILLVISIRIFSDKSFFMQILSLYKSFNSFELSILNIVSPAFSLVIWAKIFFYFILVSVFFILARTPISHIKNLLFVPLIGFFVTIIRMISFVPIDVSQILPPILINNSFWFTSIKILPFLFINPVELPEGLLYTSRFFVTAIAALVLFETTSTLQIEETLSSLEKKVAIIFPPIKKLHLAQIISISIGFIPEIFATWNKVVIAAKARNPNNGRVKENHLSNARTTTTKAKLNSNFAHFAQKISLIIAQFSALLSCLLSRAEETRKAFLNRNPSES